MTDVNKGLCIILVGPSGSGKTTIFNQLLKDDNSLKSSISATTRSPRKGEVNGIDYYFLNNDQFENMIFRNEFIEHAKIFDKYYGTPKSNIEQTMDNGDDILLILDWQGHRSLKKQLKNENIVGIFLMPPSINVLKDRLINRGDKLEDIEKRFKEAPEEITHAKEHKYIVVNNDFNVTLEQVKSIIQEERDNKLKLDSKSLNKIS
jgi:guanylate kinase